MIEGLKTLIASVGTDGIDGPTEAAGAIADGQTFSKAKSMKLDPLLYLNNNDSFSFFEEIGDLIITGPTRTNVNDLSIILAR
jgi:glycerate-2-kinase